MRQRLNNTVKWIRQLGFFIPFTWHFVGFAVITVVVWRWLNERTIVPGTAYSDVFSLLLQVALAFTAIILSLCLIPVLISWLHFYLKKQKKQVSFKVDTDEEERTVRQNQAVKIHIHPVLKPLLGFMKIRLKYDTSHYSDKFSLVEQQQRRFFSTAVDGVYYWPLPEIKEYRVSRAIIYFEDFFQFFSLAVKVDTDNRFITQPELKQVKNITAFPRKTEETTTRIEEIKRVEGEHINYKQFETNDDVRRIVWKIYAKNKELVVRIPEIMDPYASHIYLYSSFYTAFDVSGNSVVEIPFLNYYKSITWTIYRQLIQQGLEVRYVPDQQKQQHHFTNNQQEVKQAISTSQWQIDKDLGSYCKPNETAVLIVSSLSNAKELQQITEQHGNQIIILFVKLTDSLKKQSFTDIIEWVFIQQEKNDMERHKRNWSFSGLRGKITRNEREIELFLKKFEKPVMI